MFDYLGTMTETQLRERHAWLGLQLSALSASLEHIKAERDRLVEVSTDDVGAGDRTVTYTREQQGKTYILGTVTGSKVVPGKWSMQSQIQLAVENSRYPMRVDPVNHDISFGDATWKPDAKLPLVEGGTIDQVVSNDAVAASKSVSLIRPFVGLMKRPESADAKAKKIKYRYLFLTDDISEKEKMLVNFNDEVTAVEALLANTKTFVNSAGKEETVSEYETVGVEKKQDIIDPGSTENPSLFDILFPATQDAATLADGVDVTESNIRPSVADAELDRERILDAINNQPNASIEDYVAVFGHHNPPSPGQAIPQYKEQLLANIWKYAKDSLRVVSFTDSLYLKDHRPNIYLAPEAAVGLADFSEYIQTNYGISIRITELWPASVNHKSTAHFTGYACDITFALNGENSPIALDADFGHGVLSADLVDVMIGAGIKNGFFSYALNEYRKKTEFSNGKHLHVQWEGVNAKYINVGKLQNLDAVKR